MKKLIIYGANFVDTVRVIHEMNCVRPTWEIVGFIDDNPQMTHRTVCGYPVLGDYRDLTEHVKRFPDIHVFNNVNSSIAAHKIVGQKIDDLNVEVPSLIHPSVNTEFVKIGKGVFIPQGCTIGCNTVIGDYVTCRYHVVISHDVFVGDYVFFAPGVICTSHTVIESEVFLGTASTIINGVRIGQGSIIGANTLVNKDVRPHSTVVGIPMREIQKEE